MCGVGRGKVTNSSDATAGSGWVGGRVRKGFPEQATWGVVRSRQSGIARGEEGESRRREQGVALGRNTHLGMDGKEKGMTTGPGLWGASS